MAISRWQPNRGLGRVERDFDDLFNAFGWPFLNREREREERMALMPVTDINETKDGYHIEMEMPGIGKDDFKVELHNDVLTIHGEKKEEKESKEENSYCSERVYGSFSRSFRLPGQIKAEDIKAEYKDGILKLLVPKAEEAKTKQIQVH